MEQIKVEEGKCHYHHFSCRSPYQKWVMSFVITIPVFPHENIVNMFGGGTEITWKPKSLVAQSIPLLKKKKVSA